MDHPCASVFIRGWIIAASIIALAGCRSVPPPADNAPRPVPGGEVVRVNEAEGLVVTRAAVLPEAGQEAKVFSEEGEVGRIRFTSALHFPYVAAEILEGRPRRGDHFLVQPSAEEHRSQP